MRGAVAEAYRARNRRLHDTHEPLAPVFATASGPRRGASTRRRPPSTHTAQGTGSGASNRRQPPPDRPSHAPLALPHRAGHRTGRARLRSARHGRRSTARRASQDGLLQAREARVRIWRASSKGEERTRAHLEETLHTSCGPLPPPPAIEASVVTTSPVGSVSCGPLWRQRHTRGTGDRTSPNPWAQGCSTRGSTTLSRRRVAESTAHARQRHSREGRRHAITRDSRVPYCLTTYPTVSRRFNLNRP